MGASKFEAQDSVADRLNSQITDDHTVFSKRAVQAGKAREKTEDDSHVSSLTPRPGVEGPTSPLTSTGAQGPGISKMRLIILYGEGKQGLGE